LKVLLKWFRLWPTTWLLVHRIPTSGAAAAEAPEAEEAARAAALTRNIPERTVLLRRAAECDERT
jgi:hypothetical protein